jgi:hypothetical protein
MNNLDNYSVEELEKALEAKKAQANFKNKLKIAPFNQKRYESFVKEINTIVIEDIQNNDSDTSQWIYEATLKFVFGPDVFDILNKLR